MTYVKLMLKIRYLSNNPSKICNNFKIFFSLVILLTAVKVYVKKRLRAIEFSTKTANRYKKLTDI